MRLVGYFKEGKMSWLQKPDESLCVYLMSFRGIGKYIGSTYNLCKRFKQHVNSLVKNTCQNKRLQTAFNASLSFEVYELEKIASGVGRTLREQFYIDLLKPELNIAPAGIQYESKEYVSELAKLFARHVSCPHCGKPIRVTLE